MTHRSRQLRGLGAGPVPALRDSGWRSLLVPACAGQVTGPPGRGGEAGEGPGQGTEGTSRGDSRGGRGRDTLQTEGVWRPAGEGRILGTPALLTRGRGEKTLPVQRGRAGKQEAGREQMGKPIGR